MRSPLLVPVALCLSLLAASSARADDLGDLLDNIPEIEDKEAAAKAAEAEAAAAAERAADPLTEEGLGAYVARCQEHALGAFKLPRSVAKKDPGARIELKVKLYSDGSLMGLGVVTASDNEKLHKAAVEAVKSAAPFPKPPVSLRPEVANGFVVAFTASAG